MLQEQAITNFPSTPEHTASGLIGAGRPLTPSSQVGRPPWLQLHLLLVSTLQTSSAASLTT